jgi:hypothetical protein
VDYSIYVEKLSSTKTELTYGMKSYSNIEGWEYKKNGIEVTKVHGHNPHKFVCDTSSVLVVAEPLTQWQYITYLTRSD